MTGSVKCKKTGGAGGKGGGYGFIICDDERATEVFFHAKWIAGATFNDINDGDRVEFELIEGKDGRPVAQSVRLMGRFY